VATVYISDHLLKLGLDQTIPHISQFESLRLEHIAPYSQIPHVTPNSRTNHKVATIFIPSHTNTNTNIMKITAATTALLFTTLALATPAPAAQPAAPGTVAQFHDALAARDTAPIPNLAARAAAAPLDTRAKKPKGGSSNTTNAAESVTPSRTLQIAVLGLGVMEVVRLWN
jgi:hypothetical protein